MPTDQGAPVGDGGDLTGGEPRPVGHILLGSGRDHTDDRGGDAQISLGDRAFRTDAARVIAELMHSRDI